MRPVLKGRRSTARREMKSPREETVVKTPIAILDMSLRFTDNFFNLWAKIFNPKIKGQNKY